MKYKFGIGQSFVLTVKIWASAWFSFLVSIIPLYVWRGGSHSNAELGENLLMAFIGLFFGFLFLTIIQMRSDAAERCSGKEILVQAACAVAIYMIAWIILYAIGKNNFFVAVCGYYFGLILGTGADGRPTFTASLLAAVIFGVIYFFAIILGGKMARDRRAKNLNGMKK